MHLLQFLREKLAKAKKTFLGAVTFYTVIPLPQYWELELRGIAPFAPLIGIFLGGFLGLADWVLAALGMAVFTRSVLVVALWVLLTGGLHLDGVIDTADGLAVTDREKRLTVMRDSVSGAFGVMACVILLFCKVAALTDLTQARILGLMSAAGWGRWAQVVAIGCYPYLRATGKGAIHQEKSQSKRDLGFGLLPLLPLSIWQVWITYPQAALGIIAVAGSAMIAIGTGFWFNRQLGGHTGDTYGATVEWTEALVLCLLTII